MNDTPGTTPPAAPEPRPRPRYGELAPESWTWVPPTAASVDAESTGAAASAPAASDPEASDPAAPSNASAPSNAFWANQPAAPNVTNTTATSAAAAGTASTWDRPLTISLLVFGFLGSLYFIFSLLSLPETLGLMYSQLGVGDYASNPTTSALIVAGVIVESLVWLGTTALSVRMLMRGKRAFYLPLIGGVVSVIAVFVFVLAALLTDPTFIEFAGRP